MTRWTLILFGLLFLAPLVRAAEIEPAENVLTPLRQRELDRAVDRALNWLASNQRADGSFPCINTGQPAITSLAVLAFLSRGHLPQQGAYGDTIDRGIEFILSQQLDDGLFSMVPPEPVMGSHNSAHTAVYNHAISGLALSEAYGMTDRELAARMRAAIGRACVYTLELQALPKELPQDRGGWRYVRKYNIGSESDLSVTCWQLLFLRSAKNASIDVPADRIDEAAEYVGRCFMENLGTFNYFAEAPHPLSRAMAGAGMLSMSLSGKHNTPPARSAADWILVNDFDTYRSSIARFDRYFYSLFFCTQGMFQIGGRHWSSFYPDVVKVLLENQTPEGSWHEDVAGDEMYGNAYTTALCVLSLNTPRQLLPIFQR